jgi:hypothetical protein
MPTGPKFDPFKPEQPQIPGVPTRTPSAAAAQPPADQRAKRQSSSVPLQHPSNWPAWFRIGLAAVVVIAIVAVAWRARVSSAKPTQPPPVPVAAAPVPVKPVPSLPVGPGEIGTDRDLEHAWSSKRFLFRDPQTSAIIPALAVRLPGGALWGISMVEPYGTCQLAYIRNLNTLRSQYGLRATHPMVVDSCAGTVYDLSRYASGPNGLVRGQVVRGRAARPPIAIEVTQRGQSIVAVRME